MADWNKVLKCWGPVEADYSAYGVAVVTRMYTKHPETQKKFSKFVGMTTNELAGNAAFVSIATNVMKKWSDLLKCKGSHSAVLEPVSNNHVKWNIPIAQMRLLPPMVAEVLAEKSGLDSAGQQALVKAMNMVLDDMDVTYKKLGFTG